MLTIGLLIGTKRELEQLLDRSGRGPFPEVCGPESTVRKGCHLEMLVGFSSLWLEKPRKSVIPVILVQSTGVIPANACLHEG
jgi:hypothetical protein